MSGAPRFAISEQGFPATVFISRSSLKAISGLLTDKEAGVLVDFILECNVKKKAGKKKGGKKYGKIDQIGGKVR